jgi:hypothetical protein
LGAILFSLTAALIGSAYYTMTLGLGAIEAISLYTALGFGVMCGLTLMHLAMHGFFDTGR